MQWQGNVSADYKVLKPNSAFLVRSLIPYDRNWGRGMHSFQQDPRMTVQYKDVPHNPFAVRLDSEFVPRSFAIEDQFPIVAYDHAK